MDSSRYAQNAKAETPVAATFNDRLNKVVDGLQFNSDRLEAVLSRVNGTPSAKEGRPGDVAQIRPLHPLAGIVEMLENANSRLADLATGVERIA